MTDEKGRPMTYWGGSPAAPEPPERVATLRELIAEIKQPLWRLAANARLDELERTISLAQTEIKGHMRVEDDLREAAEAELDLRMQVERDLAQAQARIAELEKDAARYRWLREAHLPPTTVLTVVTNKGYGLWAKALDAAIDAALKK